MSREPGNIIYFLFESHKCSSSTNSRPFIPLTEIVHYFPTKKAFYSDWINLEDGYAFKNDEYIFAFRFSTTFVLGTIRLDANI